MCKTGCTLPQITPSSMYTTHLHKSPRPALKKWRLVATYGGFLATYGGVRRLMETGDFTGLKVGQNGFFFHIFLTKKLGKL